MKQGIIRNGNAGDTAEAKAVEWLVRLDAGSRDPDAFEKWREADPRQASIFVQIAATWRTTGNIRHSCLAPDIPREIPCQTEEYATSRSLMTRRSALTGTTASAAFIALGTGAYTHMMRKEATTGTGEQRTLLLPDGSRIALNTNSRINWQMRDDLDFRLEQDEAMMFVTDDKIHDFIASSSNKYSISALLGTGQYAMRIVDNGLKLAAIQGQAQITELSGINRILRQGQILPQRNRHITTAVLSTEQIEVITAWQQGEIIFDGMTLEQALKEFNRYLSKPVELGDMSIASLRLDGRFDSNDVRARGIPTDGYSSVALQENSLSVQYASALGTATPASPSL